MTRKHFKALADTLRNNRPPLPSSAGSVAWRRWVENSANALRIFNPRFDGGRFYDVCGYYQKAGADAWQD